MKLMRSKSYSKFISSITGHFGGRIPASYALFAFLGAVLPTASFALTEVKWTNSSGGSFIEPSNWNGSALPVGGTSYGTLDLNTGYTVTFPDGGTADFSPQFKTPYNNADATELNKLVLDFQGSFEWIDSEAGTYQGEPFKFYSNNGHFFNWESWNGAIGPAAVTNALVSLWIDKEKNNKDTVHMRIERGTFNMRKEKQNGKIVVGHVAPDDNNAIEVIYDNCATGVYGYADLRLRAYDSLIAVRGGSCVSFSNDFDFPSASDNNFYTNRLEVSGEGSYLYAGAFRFFQGYCPNRDIGVVVKDGGVFEVGELRQQSSSAGWIKVTDGGVLRLRSTGGNFMKQADSTIDLCVTNNGVLELTGNGRWGWNEWNDTCKVNLHTAGGTVRLPSGNNFNWNRDWIVEEGTDIVIDGNLYLSTSVTNNDLGITVDLSATGAHGSGALRIGNIYPCKLVITNNVVDVNYVHGANGASGATELLVGGIGRLRTGGFDFGVNGSAVLTIRDEGVADVGYCRIGYGNVNTDREVVVNIEGGRLVCTNSQINVCDNQRVCRINLTGGELYSKQTLGWNNAHYHNPSGYGYAYFVGNGGTLKAPTSNNDYFFGAFDDAKVGAKGLTVDSDYTVGIRQTFANLDNESGKIVFIGSGTKRILATGWNGYTPGTSTHSYTVVAGGTLLFETGADWQTHLVVTNGATASTVGGCTGLTLKGLTLGDADTVGTLAVDTTDVIVVDGPVSFPNGGLSFSDNIANGTYGILKVKDPETNFPVAAQKAWARMMISAGHGSGHSYTFETSVDETTGDMTLSVVVDDVKDLTGDAVWTGANGTTWSDGSNWGSAAKPGVLDSAVFSSETASASVSLGTDELIGAVEFSAEQSYAISGSGSLAFSDSGNASITVTKGSHEISARLDNSFPLPVATAEGAKVTVSGAMKPAGLVKSGDGNLTLTQEKVDSLALSDGVVTFAGSAAKTVSKLSLQAASVNRQIGLKTDVPTTVSKFEPTAGLIVKAGAEPLVIESNTSMNFAPAWGPTDNTAYTDDYVFSETGPVTQAGAAVVVTEGNLTLRGTGSSPSDVRFSAVHNIMVGVRSKDCAADPSFTLDGAQIHADKHTRIGTAYDKDGAGWKTASLTIDNGSYARFDSLFIGGDIGNVDLDNPPQINVTVDHGSRISGWYRMDINNSGRSDRRPKTLVNMLVDHGSELVDYTGNNGVLINAPGADVTFDNGSVFGRQTVDWGAAVNPGRLIFGGDSFDDHVRFLNGSRFLCSNLLYNATADWATNNLHFADGEWFAGDDDFDFVFKNGHRIAVHAEGDGLKLNPPTDRTWTMHTIMTGTDIVKGGEGTLVFDVAKYLNNSTDASSLTVNTRQSATLAITGTLKVEAGTVEIADGTAVSGDCALAVSSGATVDLGGNAVSFTALSGAGTVMNGTLSTTLEYGDGTVLPTLNGVDGTLTVDFGRTAENPLDMAAAKAGIVVAHYTGDAPVNLKVRAVNTGIARARATVACANGNVLAKMTQTGFSVIIR